MLDHVRAGSAAPPDRLELVGALGQRDCEGGTERIAGTGRVDDPRREGWDDLATEPRALFPQRDDERPRPGTAGASVSFGTR